MRKLLVVILIKFLIVLDVREDLMNLLVYGMILGMLFPAYFVRILYKDLNLVLLYFVNNVILITAMYAVKPSTHKAT